MFFFIAVTFLIRTQNCPKKFSQHFYPFPTNIIKCTAPRLKTSGDSPNFFICFSNALGQKKQTLLWIVTWLKLRPDSFEAERENPEEKSAVFQWASLTLTEQAGRWMWQITDGEKLKWGYNWNVQEMTDSGREESWNGHAHLLVQCVWGAWSLLGGGRAGLWGCPCDSVCECVLPGGLEEPEEPCEGE